MDNVKVTFSRDEALAVVICMERFKPFGWRDLALAKLLKAMGLKPLKDYK